ncbi:MAG: hypothetical protein DRP78_06020 [Candidatus Omnitrophota bacterium]|nr:MAG: hypothetical protein DRP78_06020 [Candidatus Omnitrophota bacterium]
MEFKNVLGYALIAAIICICYVNQQVEIVKLGYKLHSKENKLSRIMDKKRKLLYYDNSLKSPKYLASMLKNNSLDLTFPEPALVAKVRIVSRRKPLIARAVSSAPRVSLLDAFVPKVQAALNTGK